MPKIGIMHSGTYGRQEHVDNLNAFKEAVTNTFSGSGSVTYNGGAGNWAGNDTGKLAAIASRLLGDTSVDLVAALGGPASLNAAMTAPNPKNKKIVFSTADTDPSPVPAYVFGVCAQTASLDPERLDLLHQYAPGSTYGVLLNGSRAGVTDVATALQNAAAGWAPPGNLDLQYVDPLSTKPNPLTQIKGFFAGWTPAKGFAGVLVASDPLFFDLMDDIVPTASTYNPHVMWQWSEFEGWMSYGTDIDSCYAYAGWMAGELLNGVTPSPPIVTLAPSLTLNRGLMVSKTMRLKLDVIRQVHKIIVTKVKSKVKR
jgi:hypothetical protein